MFIRCFPDSLIRCSGMAQSRTGQAPFDGLQRFAALTHRHGAATHKAMETIQSEERQGRVADAPSGHWVYRLLPRWLWPYAQLARWDRPIGWWLLLWPCWWSAALAASADARPGDALLTLLPNPWHLVLFLVGAIAMRGAGCTYNDIVDERYRPQGRRGPARGRCRPVRSAGGRPGSSSPSRRWSASPCSCSSTVSPSSLGIVSLAVVAIYPFMKRITNWPQLGARPRLLVGRADGLGGGVRPISMRRRCCSMPARCCG